MPKLIELVNGRATIHHRKCNCILSGQCISNSSVLEPAEEFDEAQDPGPHSLRSDSGGLRWIPFQAPR